LARELHPDAAPAPQPGGAAGNRGTRQRFEQVVAAYRVLHDPAARAGYDRALSATPPAADAAGAVPHPLHGPRPAPLVAGPTVVHARPPAAPQPTIRVGPP